MSGFAGTTAVIIAWGAVGLITLWMLIALTRTARGKKRPTRKGDNSVANRSHRLGHAVVRFSQEREADAPPQLESSPRLSFMGMRGDNDSSRKTFEAETMRIYQRQFAEQVSEVGHRLRRAGRIGLSEFRILISPRQPADIETIGRQLIELGYPDE